MTDEQVSDAEMRVLDTMDRVEHLLTEGADEPQTAPLLKMRLRELRGACDRLLELLE